MLCMHSILLKRIYSPRMTQSHLMNLHIKNSVGGIILIDAFGYKKPNKHQTKQEEYSTIVPYLKS